MHDDAIAQASLLDLGVGGGRTTRHIGSRAWRYVGVDYEPKMIAACGAQFPALRFVVADARSLPFANAEFDIVLFSHNGVDYVAPLGRTAILSEVTRVLRPEGLFIFSTHNLLRADLDMRTPPRAWDLAARYRRWRLQRANPDWRNWHDSPSALVNDGAFGFGALTYHVRPSEQVRALSNAGFLDIRLFCGASGREVPNERADHELASAWFYVSCRRAARQRQPDLSR